MVVGQKVARAITSRFYMNEKSARDKVEQVPMTAEEVSVISAYGTLADYCGCFQSKVESCTGNDLRNARLLRDLPAAIKMYNTAVEKTNGVGSNSKIGKDMIDEISKVLVDLGICTENACQLEFDSVKMAQAADEIYVSILPVTVEMYACKLIEAQDTGKKLGFDEFANPVLY